MRFWKQLQHIRSKLEKFFIFSWLDVILCHLQHYGRYDVICNYFNMKEEKKLNLSSLNHMAKTEKANRH